MVRIKRTHRSSTRNKAIFISDNSVVNDNDRLSILPNVLLCHILSFLPTKLSVATSVLSSRYKYLWTDVPNLDFDCKDHTEMSFSDTVNRVMLLRNVWDINSFRIRLADEKFTEEQFDTWIRTTVARNVKALDIKLCEQVWLPRCIFTCKTLVELRLDWCGSLPDSRISLPKLKKLHLHYFQYGNCEKLQNLIYGCPVLEELNIQEINRFDLRNCIISSPTIQRLTLNLDSFDLDGHGSDSEDDMPNLIIEDFKLGIYTPAVTYLDIDDYSSQFISTGTFTSLVEAHIRLYYMYRKDSSAYCNSVLDLVDKVYQVQTLTLLIGYDQFLCPTYADVTSRFINLTKLELTADWIFLLKFLRSADNLEVLILGEVEDDAKCSWEAPQQVPTCLSSRLRHVAINDFNNLEVEFELAGYILRNGKVLNMMNICSPKWKNVKDLEKKFDALQRISEFERRSATCKLRFQ